MNIIFSTLKKSYTPESKKTRTASNTYWILRYGIHCVYKVTHCSSGEMDITHCEYYDRYLESSLLAMVE